MKYRVATAGATCTRSTQQKLRRSRVCFQPTRSREIAINLHGSTHPIKNFQVPTLLDMKYRLD